MSTKTESAMLKELRAEMKLLTAKVEEVTAENQILKSKGGVGVEMAKILARMLNDHPKLPRRKRGGQDTSSTQQFIFPETREIDCSVSMGTSAAGNEWANCWMGGIKFHRNSAFSNGEWQMERVAADPILFMNKEETKVELAWRKLTSEQKAALIEG